MLPFWLLNWGYSQHFIWSKPFIYLKQILLPEFQAVQPLPGLGKQRKIHKTKGTFILLPGEHQNQILNEFVDDVYLEPE